VLACSGSKYTAAPTLSALNELLETGEKIAVVGRPCQVTSIRKMLKPGGRLVIQEGLKKISTKILQKQVVGAGFKLVTIKTGEPKDEDIIAVFKKP